MNMNIMNFENLSFTFVSREEFIPVFRELRPTVFNENNDIDLNSYWSEEEKTKNNELQQMCKTEIRSYLLCKDGEKVAGWSFGVQKDAEEFYMVNSAVMPEYRNLGIYKSMLDLIIEKAKKEGFQVISSIHHASNNAILIPKLKIGFKIVGLKINPRFGTLLELHYFTNEKISKIMDYRTGYSKNLAN